METSTKTRDNYGALLAAATRIDTTANGGNGYPRHLKVAYTADTMGELRDLYDAATAEGRDVTVLCLHRRDGWGLWERSNIGNEHDLDDDRWMGTSESDWTITIDKDSDTDADAFALICGETREVDSARDLFETAEAVKALAAELIDPDELEDGEEVIYFLDGNNGGWGINYSVKTGQNGYAYDTHQYCMAIQVGELEEEA